MTEKSQFDERRHSERVLMRVPVKVRGIAADGSVLEEDSYTGVVGTLGAMIRTSRLLRIDSEVEVTNRFSKQTATFRVVWVKGPQDDNLWEIGIEALQPLDGFWGVRFPSSPDEH